MKKAGGISFGYIAPGNGLPSVLLNMKLLMAYKSLKATYILRRLKKCMFGMRDESLYIRSRYLGVHSHLHVFPRNQLSLMMAGHACCRSKYTLRNNFSGYNSTLCCRNIHAM